MISPIYTWLIVAIMLSVVEMLSPGLFFFLSFSLGALITAGMSLVFGTLAGQLNVFFVSSLVAFLVLHQWVKRRQGRFHPASETNMDALKGKKVHLASVSSHARTGSLRIDGDVWTARAIDNKQLQEGALVEVIGIKGCHVLVKTVEKHTNH